MGAGFALYVPQESVSLLLEILACSRKAGDPAAYRAGHIERSDTKRVIITEKSLEYAAETLAVR